jgi:thymidylate synthase (FAD)
MMEVRLLAVTRLVEPVEGETDIDSLAEFAGRACYESFHKPNPGTASNVDYLANILRQQHASVLEHGSASFYLMGVSRSLLAELTRHRHLSFSVRSTRYVDERDAHMIVPPAIASSLPECEPLLEQHADQVRRIYLDIYSRLRDQGLDVKQAREAARCVLPSMAETRIVVTGNMRAWREVIQKRISKSADAEFQNLAQTLLLLLIAEAPNSFQDMLGLLDRSGV